jgi:hypothetical protein
MRLTELSRVPFHVRTWWFTTVGIGYLSGSNASIFDLVQLLDFHLLPNLSVLFGSWTRSQRVASTKFTTEKFTFIPKWFSDKWFFFSLGKHSWLSFSILLLGGARCNGSLECKQRYAFVVSWRECQRIGSWKVVLRTFFWFRFRFRFLVLIWLWFLFSVFCSVFCSVLDLVLELGLGLELDLVLVLSFSFSFSFGFGLDLDFVSVLVII